MNVRAGLAAVILVAGVSACAPAETGGPPKDPGVCYHVAKGADGKPAYEAVEYNVPNLETCATRLEARRLMLGKDQAGTYEGRYVFADAQAISSGKEADGSDRLPVFNAEMRKKIDDGLQVLIEQKKADDAEAAKAKKAR